MSRWLKFFPPQGNGEQRKTPPTRGAWVIVVLFFTGLAATSPFWLFLLTSKSGVTPPLRRLAVLPFLGAENSDDDRLLEGMAASLAGEISRYQRLETVSYQESRAFKTSQSDLRNVARTLGSDFLLTGTGVRIGNDLILKVYVASVHRPNIPFWLHDYKLTGGKTAPDLQHRIAGDVVRAIAEFR